MPKPDQEWARRRVEAKRDEDHQNRQNPKVIEKIQREAKAHGTTLASGGKGGLDPTLAYQVFIRDGWKCRIPGCKTPRTNLSLDHIGGHPKEIFEAAKHEKIDSKILKGAKLGHDNSMADVAAICDRHHDLLHQRERALEAGKKPKALEP